MNDDAKEHYHFPLAQKSANKPLQGLRISGFGQTRPCKGRAGFGRVAEAMRGLANLIGEPDGPPMSPGYPPAIGSREYSGPCRFGALVLR